MSRFSTKLLTGILVTVFFGIALYIRVYFPYATVFGSDWIKYTGIDAYYQMYLVDNLVHNFPHLMDFDPYFIYPGGLGVGSIRFFNWLLACITWVIGLGSPTQHTIDVVGVYFPAVLGALTVIPVYFIGKELFSRWVGILSAGLIAIMAGEFLGRSILGSTDQHVAETLFSTITILFLILAIKTARQKQLTFNHLSRREWAIITKPIVYSLLTGIFLGIYLMTWTGALLFAFIISIYFIIQFIIDHLEHKSTDYLCAVGVILFLVALLIFLPVSPGSLYTASLVIAVLIPPILSGISWLMTRRETKPAYYLLALVLLGAIGAGILRLVAPSLLGAMWGSFRIFAPQGAQLTTLEMQPLFFPEGSFSTAIVWGNFNTSFFFSFISFILLIIYLVIKRGEAEKNLLIVWSLVILAATIGQRRFAYYLAVNVALLTGYLSVLAYFAIRFVIDYLRNERTDYMSWQIFESPDLKELATQPAKPSKREEREKAKKGKGRESRSRITTASVSIGIWAILVIFFLAFFPNPKTLADAREAGVPTGVAWWNTCLVGTAVVTAEQARFTPTDAWYSSLDWLRENTPDPFDNPDFYYELHKPPFQYPESAYGVLAWWDYGYWITRIAHRIPNANPSQDPVAITNVARFFTSQDEGSVNETIQKLGSSYVIIDYDTATSKFWAIATWAGKKQTDFFDVYYVLQNNQPMQVYFFYPEYYRSLSTRLYNFDGKAVTPKDIWVISYQKVADSEGNLYKVIASAKQFDTYNEAEDYRSSQNSTSYRIIGDNPFVSPVPLEALEHYSLAYSSNSSILQPSGEMVPAVKIFEYIK